MTYYKVCPISKISSKTPTPYVIDGVKILVAQDSANNIWVFDATCTHADKSLENGKWNSEKATITCPFHFAVFSIPQEGLALSPPAVTPLTVYSTKIQNIDSEPFLYVDLDS